MYFTFSIIRKCFFTPFVRHFEFSRRDNYSARFPTPRKITTACPYSRIFLFVRGVQEVGTSILHEGEGNESTTVFVSKK